MSTLAEVKKLRTDNARLRDENTRLTRDLLAARRRDPNRCDSCGGSFEYQGGGTGGLCGFCQDAQWRSA